MLSAAEKCRRYREKNREALLARKKAHYYRHRESILAKKSTPEGRAIGAANMRKARKAKPELYKAAWRKWHDAHPEVKARKDRESYERRKANGKSREYHLRKYQRDKKRGLYPLLLARGLRSGKKQREVLNDCYVKCLILRTNGIISRADIPQELVELKRAQIQLKRELKNHPSNTAHKKPRTNEHTNQHE